MNDNRYEMACVLNASELRELADRLEAIEESRGLVGGTIALQNGEYVEFRTGVEGGAVEAFVRVASWISNDPAEW